MLLILYPKCSTCKNSEKFLIDNNISYNKRDIVLEKLNQEELDKLIKKSNLDINKFFNTSGILYREMNLKDKLPNMNYQEKIDLLSSNGMLVKRPILELDNNVLVGFKTNEWINILGIEN